MPEVLLTQADIPAAALDIVQERVDRVARRANRKGFPAPRLVTGDRELRTIKVPSDGPSADLIEKQVEYVNVSIVATDDALRINGWTFIASVDPLPLDDGALATLYRRVPGTEAIPLPKWDKEPDACDHCGYGRRRKETFILFGDSRDPDIGEYKQVGRQCVRDFIGYDPESMLAAIEAYGSLTFDEDEVRGWGSSAPALFSLDAVLTAAAQAVLFQGFYVSKKKAEETEVEAYLDGSRALQSTGSVVRFLLTPPRNRHDLEERRKYAEVGDEKVAALVAATYEGIEELRQKADTSEWEDNVLLLSRASHMEWLHVGIFASAILLGSRRQERVARQRVAADTAPSVHFGEVGKRLDFEAVIERVRLIDNDFGGVFLVKMRTGDSDLMWWATNFPPKVPAKQGEDGAWVQQVDYDAGDRIKVRATVKAHETDKYSGQPITVITRAKVEPLIEAPPPALIAIGPGERVPDELPF